MARKPQGGDLYYRVSFWKKGTSSDGHGGTTSAYTKQFECRAAYTHMRAGEQIQAARLEGKHIQVISVRRSAQAELATTDWQIRDERDSPPTIFNIRDIEPQTDRQFISFLCESGVATN